MRKGWLSESVTIANVGRPLGLPGSVAQACAGVFSQAVRSAGKIESHTVFRNARTPTACATPESSSAFLPSPSALTGWFASGTLSRCYRSRELAGTVCQIRRYIRKRNNFPNRLRMQMVTGWVVCRTWCINARRWSSEFVTIADVGRPLGLPGSVAQACTGVLSQAVRSAGKIEFHTVFRNSPHTYGVRQSESPSAFLPSPSALRAGSRPEQYRVGAVAVVGRGSLAGSEVYAQKERFPESVTIANVDRLGGLPGVVHKRGKGGCLNLLSVADVGRPLGLPGSVAQAGAAVISQAVRPAGSPFLLRQLHPPFGLFV